MGNAPTSPPGVTPVASGGETPAKSTGTDRFHLLCPYHGDVGTYDAEETAAKAAAGHLRKQHTSAVESKVGSLGVEIRHAKVFTVADLAGYEEK